MEKYKSQSVMSGKQQRRIGRELLCIPLASVYRPVPGTPSLVNSHSTKTAQYL
jgi:hypothetical protein